MKYELKKISEPSKFEGLDHEIKETLLFFIRADMEIYGQLTEATKNCITVQGYEFIEVKKEILSKKKRPTTISGSKELLLQTYDKIEDFVSCSSETNYVGVKVDFNDNTSINVVMKRAQFHQFNFQRFFGIITISGLGYYTFKP